MRPQSLSIIAIVNLGIVVALYLNMLLKVYTRRKDATAFKPVLFAVNEQAARYGAVSVCQARTFLNKERFISVQYFKHLTHFPCNVTVWLEC
jgi:hypothetical protein